MRHCADVIGIARMSERQFSKVDTFTKTIHDSIALKEAFLLSTELSLLKDSTGRLLDQMQTLKIGSDSLSILIHENKLTIITNRSESSNRVRNESIEKKGVEKEYIKEIVPIPKEVFVYKTPLYIKYLLFILFLLSIKTIGKIFSFIKGLYLSKRG